MAIRVGYSHIDIAQVRNDEGMLYGSVAIGRASKDGLAQPHECANRHVPWNWTSPTRTILTPARIQVLGHEPVAMESARGWSAEVPRKSPEEQGSGSLSELTLKRAARVRGAIVVPSERSLLPSRTRSRASSSAFGRNSEEKWGMAAVSYQRPAAGRSSPLRPSIGITRTGRSSPGSARLIAMARMGPAGAGVAAEADKTGPFADVRRTVRKLLAAKLSPCRMSLSPIGGARRPDLASRSFGAVCRATRSQADCVAQS
jgi:hypothetical protein